MTGGDVLKNTFNDELLVRTVSMIVVTLFALCCLLPFVYVFFTSFMPYEEYLENPMKIIPSTIDFSAYKQLAEYDILWSAYGVTLFITIVGTALSVFFLVVSAYPLSKKNLIGNKFIMRMIIFTMFFNGGMIPNYLLIRNLGLIDNVWALILPGCLNAFYLILVKNFILTTIPPSLEEAAEVDGASHLRILFRIIFPLLKPVIATMIVFCSVGYWNSYYSAMLYMSDRNKWPLQLVLRELIVRDSAAGLSQIAQQLNSANMSHSFTLKMAAIILTILPILVVYPFMQKHFVTGVTLGSVKE